MTGLCKDCANWYKFYESQKTGTCEAVDSTENEEKQPAENGFSITVETLDDQGLSYSLSTGPMFGCVAFKSKGAKK